MANKDPKAVAKATVKSTKKTVKKVEATVVKTVEELREDLAKAIQDLTDSRRSHAQGDLVNPHILTVQRKSIARLKTALRKESK